MSTPETYHRVLVPLDGSPLAEAVLPFMSRLARPLGLEIALLRVVPMVTPQIVEGGGRQIILDQGERLREEAEAYLRGVAARLVADGFRVTTTVRTGEAAPEIVAGARECQADLIGMMTHGRTGLGRLLFGSVAEAVLRHAAVPVFVVRATEAQLARSAVEVAQHPVGP
jgi:nucleotide-binding universal stress UspA family protein